MKSLRAVLVALVLLASVAVAGVASVKAGYSSSGSAISSDSTAPMFIACEENGCPCPDC